MEKMQGIREGVCLSAPPHAHQPGSQSFWDVYEGFFILGMAD